MVQNSKIDRKLGLILIFGLLCIIYTSFVVSISQSGPSWEVPQSAMLYISLLPIAILIGAITVYKSIGLKNQMPKEGQLNWPIMVISILSFVFPIIVALMDIEQWPVSYPTVSGFLKLYFLPITLIISVFVFIHIMKRINGINEK